MNIKQLIERLEAFEPTLEVVVSDSDGGELSHLTIEYIWLDEETNQVVIDGD